MKLFFVSSEQFWKKRAANGLFKVMHTPERPSHHLIRRFAPDPPFQRRGNQQISRMTKSSFQQAPELHLIIFADWTEISKLVRSPTATNTACTLTLATREIT